MNLFFFDITATHEARGTVIEMAKKVAETVFIPFTVGGGIKSVDDFRELLLQGADKISINSSAIRNPQLISEAAQKFGSQCVVVAIDAKRNEYGSWNVYINGGRIDTGLDALEWAKKAESLGAGEILLTSMDCDGTKNGYDIELTKTISENVSIPVIASGGAGNMSHFKDALTDGKADAALAASLFHFREIEICDLKNYLENEGILSGGQNNMNYKETLEYIHSIPKFNRILGNALLEKLLNKMGNPQDNLKFIHIGGTNGKGSTCTMVSQILTEAGYKTGLFTSPFLKFFNERIKINGVPISNSDLADIASYVKKITEKYDAFVSEFAFDTAVAFEYFNRQNCDFVILEVGLGGKLDATNIIKNPLVVGFTAIGLDHCQYLGNTIDEISKEKAGIIKEKFRCGFISYSRIKSI